MAADDLPADPADSAVCHYCDKPISSTLASSWELELLPSKSYTLRMVLTLRALAFPTSPMGSFLWFILTAMHITTPLRPRVPGESDVHSKMNATTFKLTKLSCLYILCFPLEVCPPFLWNPTLEPSIKFNIYKPLTLKFPSGLLLAHRSVQHCPCPCRWTCRQVGASRWAQKY